MAYKGKYPTRIKSVYSLKDDKSAMGVTLNNGDRYKVFAQSNDYAMPKTGVEMTSYSHRAVRAEV